MKKYLIWVLLFSLGALVGYYVGAYQYSQIIDLALAMGGMGGSVQF